MAKEKFGEFVYTEEELLKQFAEATAQAKEADLREPRATDAYYDDGKNRVVVDLVTGVTISFPPDLLQGLRGASASDLAEVEVSPLGTSVHWEKLDADFSVPGLVAGVFGTRAWMADLGSRGGKATSAAKAAAARVNGQKGGRPRKVPMQPAAAGAKRASHLGLEHQAGEMREFEARLAGGKDFRPAHIPRVLQNVSHFHIRTLDKVRQQLDEDVEILVASDSQEVFEGQMMRHPVPTVPKEILIQENRRVSPEGDVFIMELVG